MLRRGLNEELENENGVRDIISNFAPSSAMYRNDDDLNGNGHYIFDTNPSAIMKDEDSVKLFIGQVRLVLK